MEVLADDAVWQFLDRLVQWLILPAIAVIWSMNNRLSMHDREILRILTILEERDHRRGEDREDWQVTVKTLREATQVLAEKISRMNT